MVYNAHPSQTHNMDWMNTYRKCVYQESEEIQTPLTYVGDWIGYVACLIHSEVGCSAVKWLLQWTETLSYYTGCNRRNGPDFGRVFLMLYYTDITQNTHIKSWTVWEIMAIENCGLLCGPRTIAVSWESYLLEGLLAEQPGRRVTSPLTIPVWCTVLRTVSISMTRMQGALQLQLMALCHSQITVMKSTDINITETTYSCQFQYEFGNQ